MVPKKIDPELERKEILRRYGRLLRAAKFSKSKEDKKLIRKAFNIAHEAHKNVRRKSGEPYIYHPLAVAKIVAGEIGLGTTSIVCALLHDTVEDTHITLKDILRDFGKKCVTIVDGLTKIQEAAALSNSSQAENFKKIILTLPQDSRVILIKLADRLDNMRTLDAMPREKQLKIASETLFIYAPLGHRLGLYNIKSELEDLSLSYTEPVIYQEIASKLKKTKAVRTRFVNRFKIPIVNKLKEEGVDFEVKGRTKSIYSIYNKMQNKNIEFEDVYDVFAIRIIFNSSVEQEKASAWKIYSIVTDFYKPNPDRLRDWISTPKANGYESLHTTVMSPTGKWVEVQVRSRRMDSVAEKGYAAHWRYKEGNSVGQSFDRWLSQIRDLLENPDVNAVDFLDDFKLNLSTDEVYVFSPKGDLYTLPNGATTLDFAFQIHTQVGATCVGAKVNHRLVPLSYRLKSGDQVSIITKKLQKPREDWLNYVITARAKSKIKSSLRDEERKVAGLGKEIVQRRLNNYKIDFNNESLQQLSRFYNLSLTEIYVLVAQQKLDLSLIKPYVKKNGVLGKKVDEKDSFVKEPPKTKVKRKVETLVLGHDKNLNSVDYALSPCCNPISGDSVFGFLTVADGIKIHKTNCPNATQLLSKYAYRVIPAKWANDEQKEYMAGIKFAGFDDIGLVNKITGIISSDLHVNMKKIGFESHDGIFKGEVHVIVYDNKHLNMLIEKLKNVSEITQVERF